MLSNTVTKSKFLYFFFSFNTLKISSSLQVILFLLEYLALIPYIAEQSFYLRKAVNDTHDINNIFKYISLYYYFQLLKNNNHYYDYFYIIIVILLTLIHALYKFYLCIKVNIEIIRNIIIILYEVIIFRLLSLYIVDIIISLYVYCYKEKEFEMIFLSFIVMIVIIVYMSYSIYSNFVVFPIFFSNSRNKYPYTAYTAKYELAVFFMKILISLNSNIYTQYQYVSYNNKLFAAMILISVCLLFISTLYNIYYKAHNVIENIHMNQMRFIIFFSAFLWGLITLCFHNSRNVWLILFCSSINVIFDFIAMFYVNEVLLLKNILNSKKRILVIQYIIDKIADKEILSDISEEGKVNNLPSSNEQFKISLRCHYLQCGNCFICNSLLSLTDDTNLYIKYFNVLYSNVLHNSRLSKMDHEHYYLNSYLTDYLSIISIYLNKKMNVDINKAVYCNYNFKLRFSLKFMISKHCNQSNNIIFNFLLIHHLLFENGNNVNGDSSNSNQMDLKILSAITYISNSISTTVQKIESFIDNELKKLDDFISLSTSLFSMHNKKIMNLLNQRDSVHCYPIVISRFIYEEILNMPVSKIDGMIRNELKDVKDVLTKSFLQETLISIKINFMSEIENIDNLIILRCGHDLISHLNKNLSSLFIREFRDEGISLFKEYLHKNCTSDTDNTFEFIIKYNENDIAYMKLMIFFISNTLNANEIVLTGEYNISTKGLLITRYKEINDLSNEIIYKISNRLCNLLGVGNNTSNIERDDNSPLHISLDLISNIRKCRNKGINVFEFYILQFQLLYFKVVNQNGTKEKKSFEKKRLSRIETERNDKYKKNILFSMKQTIIGKKSIFKYNVYLANSGVKNVSIQSNNNISSGDMSMLQKKNSQFKNTTFSVFSKNIGTICEESSIQMSTSTVILSQNSNRGDKIKSIDNILSQKSQTKYSRFKIVVFSNVLLLIVLSFTLLFLEIFNNNEFFRIYTFYTSFRTFLRLYYHFISYAYSVVCIGDFSISETYCVNYFDEYTKYYNTKYNDDFNISQLTQLELTMKVSDFMARAINMTSQVYNLNVREVTELYYSKYNYTKIAVNGENNTIHLFNVETTFLEGLKLLSNSFEILIQNYTFTREPVYIISMNTSDFSNIKNPNKLSEWQIEYYNTLLNYQKFLLTWNRIKEELDRLKSGLMKRIQYIMLYFVIGMFILENILVLLLFIILKSFIKIIKIRVNETMHKLKDKVFFSFFKRKISNLALLSKYYEKDPSTILDDLTKLYSEYNIITKPSPNQKSKKETSKNDLLFISDNERALKDIYLPIKTYNRVTKPYIHIIISIEIFFVLLFLVYVFVLILIINQTSKVFDIIEGNTIAENNVYNELTLFQVMILTNQTQGMISSYIDSVQNDNFIVEDLFSSIESIYVSDSDIKKIPSLFPLINSVLDFDCYTMYSTYNDPRLKKLNAKYPERTYYKKLGDMCSRFEIMRYKIDQLMYQYMFYELSAIIQNINDFSYQGLVKAYEQKRYFNVVTMQFFIYRPLRSWMNGTPYARAINNATSLQITTVIAYIVCLIVSQIIMSFVLIIYLFHPLQQLNKKLGLLKRVFNIKKN